MSRIILKEYPGGDQHIVVGWDHPCRSFFWQEFNQEPEPAESGEVNWDDHEDWVEMRRFGGYIPGEMPNMEAFLDKIPPDIRALVTLEVQDILEEHRIDPDSGYNTQPIRLITWEV